MAELNINLGCGGNRIPGWSNHDQDVDITKPLPWPDNSADFILIEHCLEHVNCADALRFLDEARRILKPGCRLRICVPAAREELGLAHMRDLILAHGHQQVYNWHILTAQLSAAGFSLIEQTQRRDCDGHWKAIGVVKDDLETIRLEAVK